MLIGLGLGMVPFIGPVLNGLSISSCLTLGGYLYSDRVANDQKAEFGNFFDGFQDIPKIIVLNLILFGLAILILIPFVMSVGVSALMGSVEDRSGPAVEAAVEGGGVEGRRHGVAERVVEPHAECDFLARRHG